MTAGTPAPQLFRSISPPAFRNGRPGDGKGTDNAHRRRTSITTSGAGKPYRGDAAVASNEFRLAETMAGAIELPGEQQVGDAIEHAYRRPTRSGPGHPGA